MNNFGAKEAREIVNSVRRTSLTIALDVALKAIEVEARNGRETYSLDVSSYPAWLVDALEESLLKLEYIVAVDDNALFEVSWKS